MQYVLSSIALVASTLSAAQGATLDYATSFNQYGYDVISLSTTSAGVIDLNFVSGYVDAMLSLFDATTGRHLISNDDTVPSFGGSLKPRITQDLPAGQYSVLATYCCSTFTFIALSPGETFSGTDGFNAGIYRLGGSATLPVLESNLQTTIGSRLAIFAPYNLQITGDNFTIPEPSILELLGISLAGFALSRWCRRRS